MKFCYERLFCMKILLSHPTGNRNVREVIAALSRAGQLKEFHTTIAANPNSSLLKILPNSLKKEWLRRSYNLPDQLIVSHPFLEAARIFLSKVGLQSAVAHESGWASVDSVYQNLDHSVASRLKLLAENEAVQAVYAYEDGALETFRQAKKLGIKCIYDLPIAYWETARELLLKEAKRLPDWAITLGGGINDSYAKLDRKTQEMELADLIVCPGKFVSDSIPFWAKEKEILIVPFGSPKVIQLNPIRKHDDMNRNDRPLRLLFVGSMGQRKGLGDLFEAVKKFSSREVELIVMGSLMAPMEFYRSLFPEFKYEKGRPHNEVLELMRSCDVFCLPSIVEGRALVMQEAMSQGLPLIITANTGGEDLIIEGETGFLVPSSSPDSIAEKINWFLGNREKICVMGELAKKHAALYSWENYGNKISEKLESFFSSSTCE